MDVETDGNDKRLNKLVAVTVVILSVFGAITKVKDDNIVQAMQKAKSELVDAWAEYQAARIKLHVDENGLAQTRLLETAGGIDKTLSAKLIAEYESDLKKYTARSQETIAKAKALEAEYDRLNFRDDQFDFSDAFLSIAVALSAVAALANTYWLLYVAWGSGIIGLIFGLRRVSSGSTCGRSGWRSCSAPDQETGGQPDHLAQHKPMAEPPQTIDGRTAQLLIFLSILWGGSFFFTGAAVRELPPLTIVLARVALGAAFLLPVFKLLGGTWPRTLAGWMPFLGMGLLNNVIPFTLQVGAQLYVSSGVTSVLNATTPVFGVIVLAAFGDERLIARRAAGVAIGLLGVVVLRGVSIVDSSQTLGILLGLGGALSYGFAGLWGRRMLSNVPPINSATCQLLCSTAVMLVLAAIFEQPWQLPLPSTQRDTGAARPRRILDLARLHRVLHDPRPLRRHQHAAGDAADSRHRHPARPFRARRAAAPARNRRRHRHRQRAFGD